MNIREKTITEIIKNVIVEGWEKGEERSFPIITKQTNFVLRQMGFVSPVTPKQIGVYMRKYLGLHTERRGDLNITYPIVVPEIIKKLKDISLS